MTRGSILGVMIRNVNSATETCSLMLCFSEAVVLVSRSLFITKLLCSAAIKKGQLEHTRGFGTYTVLLSCSYPLRSCASNNFDIFVVYYILWKLNNLFISLFYDTVINKELRWCFAACLQTRMCKGTPCLSFKTTCVRIMVMKSRHLVGKFCSTTECYCCFRCFILAQEIKKCTGDKLVKATTSPCT